MLTTYQKIETRFEECVTGFGWHQIFNAFLFFLYSILFIYLFIFYLYHFISYSILLLGKGVIQISQEEDIRLTSMIKIMNTPLFSTQACFLSRKVYMYIFKNAIKRGIKDKRTYIAKYLDF